MKTKHGLLFGFTVLLIAVLCIFVDCKMDTDDGGGSRNKLATLSSIATYDQANAKLDEIVTYCNAHPGTKNDWMMSHAKAWRASINSDPWRDGWIARGADTILIINNIIRELE